MKRFLIPLSAALALPTTVNAESYWLILTYGYKGYYGAMEKIEMENAEKCESEGRQWENSPTQGEKSGARRFHCVTGK